MRWLRGLLGQDEAPLTGAPAVRRVKTYSAQSGYVYQYFYCGQRPYRQGREPGVEFVFDVSADRKSGAPVSVRVPDESVAAWEARNERELSANERYAIAKMALFQAFDERAEPGLMRQPVVVRAADVDGILDTLDLA